MQLQTATMDDLALIGGWFDSPAALTLWGGPRLGYPPEPGRLAREMDWPEAENLLWRKRGEPVAFVQLFRRESRRHIARLAVSPPARGQGLARMLLAELFQRCPGEDFSLAVYRDNLRALRLYRELGFVESGTVDAVPDCLMMVRRHGDD
ncbi:GNAT family N-acetyltransferase [Zobellella sp. DQSA1]|uniref:GNAT family N-acetyltransferase n=1 Tax=Zobellella sp. DQSA1 TaxID=3342386 RepID=UPI0035C0BCAF